MIDEATGGFGYEVSDEQIEAYRRLPIDRRVRWVEEMARTTFALASPTVRARWSALRRGDAIDGPTFRMRVQDDLRGGRHPIVVCGAVEAGRVHAGAEVELDVVDLDGADRVVRARVSGIEIDRRICGGASAGDVVGLALVVDGVPPGRIEAVRGVVVR